MSNKKAAGEPRSSANLCPSILDREDNIVGFSACLRPDVQDGTDCTAARRIPAGGGDRMPPHGLHATRMRQ